MKIIFEDRIDPILCKIVTLDLLQQAIYVTGEHYPLCYTSEICGGTLSFTHLIRSIRSTFILTNNYEQTCIKWCQTKRVRKIFEQGIPTTYIDFTIRELGHRSKPIPENEKQFIRYNTVGDRF